MPRPPKPYKEHGYWVSRPFGEYWRLCPVAEPLSVAKEVLANKLRERRDEQERTGGGIMPNLTVAELFVLFLEAVEAEKSEHTFLDYQRWCVEFAKLHGRKHARDLRRYAAVQFKHELLKSTWVRNRQPPQPYKAKSINHAIIAVRRAFNWAIESELLPPNRNPFARIKLLPAEGRQRVATEEEYQTLLSSCTDDAFRDVLIAMRYTPARPGDVRSLTWANVQWDQRRWVIPKHKTSKTAKRPKPRIIGMNDAVEALLRRRQKACGHAERVFVNSHGKPWTRNALGLRMRRLRKRAGIKPDANGEEFVLYTNRHTFLTYGAMNPDVSKATLKEVAGVTSDATIDHYTHIAGTATADAGRRIADTLLAQTATPGR